MRLFVSEAARRDVRNALSASRRSFGERQARTYAGLIKATVALIVEDPVRPSSISRPTLRRDVRSLHLEVAAGRRGAAAHVVFYQRRSRPDADDVLGILRVLHEAMNPEARVAEALKEFDDRE